MRICLYNNGSHKAVNCFMSLLTCHPHLSPATYNVCFLSHAFHRFSLKIFASINVEDKTDLQQYFENWRQARDITNAAVSLTSIFL